MRLLALSCVYGVYSTPQKHSLDVWLAHSRPAVHVQAVHQVSGRNLWSKHGHTVGRVKRPVAVPTWLCTAGGQPRHVSSALMAVQTHTVLACVHNRHKQEACSMKLYQAADTLCQASCVTPFTVCLYCLGRT